MSEQKPKLVVSNWKHIGKGTLVGRFDVHITLMDQILIGCTLMQKDGRKWVGMPSTQFEKRDGTKGYQHHVKWGSQEMADRFSAAVVPLVEQLAAQDSSAY